MSGLERVLADEPDLVVLDVMMPRMSGLEVCKQVKAKRPSVPIIMLTARGQEIDKVVGLELGADDYVTKPFSIRELMARVKAVLRRMSAAGQPHPTSTGSVTSRSTFAATRCGAPAAPSSCRRRSSRLLAYFIAHPAETLSRDRLLDAVWGYENYPNTRTVDTHIVHLETEARTESRAAALHRDGARHRLQVRRVRSRPMGHIWAFRVESRAASGPVPAAGREPAAPGAATAS